MDSRRSPKLGKIQAAMEYLMTYGWAILVIAIVLGVLYYFGVFTGPSIGNSCLATGGYLCTNPIMNASGYLEINFAINGNPITITGINCTMNSTQPAIFQSLAQTELQNGNVATINVRCLGAGGPIGKKYSGYLWINYTTATQNGLYAKVAIIDTVVSVEGKLPSATVGSGACKGSGTNSTTITSYYSATVSSSTTANYVMYGGGGAGGAVPINTNGNGLSGNEMTGNIVLTSGETLTIYVGGGGGGGGNFAGGGGGSGYYGGGGGGSDWNGGTGGGGGGGGSSAILVNDALQVSAPGGAGGNGSSGNGGAGGTGSSGGAGGTGPYVNGGAGSQYNGGTGGSGTMGYPTCTSGNGGSAGTGGTAGQNSGGGGGYGGGGGTGQNGCNGGAAGSGGSNGGNGGDSGGTGGDSGTFGIGDIGFVGYGGSGGSVTLTWPGSSCPI